MASSFGVCEEENDDDDDSKSDPVSIFMLISLSSLHGDF